MDQISSDTVPRSQIQALDRAAAILTALAEAGPAGAPLRALVAAVELHSSTARTLLNSLLLHGLAEQDTVSRNYRIGPRFLELNRIYQRRADLSTVAAPMMRDLWERSAETIHLSILQGGQRVDVAVLVGPQVLTVNPAVARGVTMQSAAPPAQLHHTAAGKVLLAGLSTSEIEAVLADETPAQRRRIVSELSQVREQGFATNTEEAAVGVHGVAAPVVDAAGTVVATLCIGYPSPRATPNHATFLTEAVIESAAAISQLLGWVAE